MTPIRTAGILAIGDEITLGQKTDTNSGAIAEQLSVRGVRVTEHSAVPDDLASVAGALRRLAESNDLVISTGGLGPTEDDLTRRALADAMGCDLVEDDGALAQLMEWSALRGRDLSANQRLQALRPERAEILENKHGTAPALSGAIGDCVVLCLPGPPGEMTPILEQFIAQRVVSNDDHVIRTRIVRVPALAEAECAARLGELMSRDRNPVVGTTASGAIVDVRIRYEGNARDAGSALDKCEAQVRRLVHPFDLMPGEDSIAQSVVRLLGEMRGVLVTAESCTGGLIARRVTDIAGSSDVFAGGWVTYSNEMKVRELGVSEQTLDRSGAVSTETAREMALGALEHAPEATHALAVTGIAGPGGGTEQKPLGTVFIACAERDGQCTVRRFLFPGDRSGVRHFTANVALAMLRFGLLGVDPGRLLGEILEGA